MDLDSCIKGRRSVRGYTDEPVSKEMIEAVLEAGTWAPSGMNRQPWRFIVIEDEDVIKMVSKQTKKIVPEVMPQMSDKMQTEADVICYNAPVLIFICAEKDGVHGDLDMTDSVLAAQNMFLKAHELGLGACYMGFIAFLSRKPEILEKAGVPGGYELKVPLALGHPKEKPGPGNRNEPEIIEWIK